jgi:hypothetical protein
MLYGQSPKWIDRLERLMPGLGIPNLALILCGAQAIGFFFVLSQGDRAFNLLVLYPDLVLKGELWRLVTFLAVPLSLSPIWMVFVLMFMYFIINAIEQEWGEFRTTLYVLVAIGLAVTFSLAVGWPIYSPATLESTLFLAAATIAPEYQILLFFVIPAKLKWLAWLSVAFIVWQLIFGSWLARFYLLVMYANYLLFFGPYFAGRLKAFQRRKKFQHDVASSRPAKDERDE